MRPFIDSTSSIDDLPALQQRMEDEGYLLLRGLLPVEDVQNVQKQLGEIAKQAGWLHATAPVQACIASSENACVDPAPEYLEVLRLFNCCFDFYALSHHPNLVGLLEKLLGDEILVHPKPLPRNIFPSLQEYTTPAHQDFPNIQGTEEVYTAWVPLMNCDKSVGGLQVATGSHKQGVYQFGIGNGAGGIEIVDPLTGRWVGSEMALGDVLLFHSMLVHKGVPNVSDKLRMSFDARYQRVSDPFNPDNAESPYGLPLTWDEVYEHWPDIEVANALKYYWQRLDLTHKAFDPHWFDLRDELGFELGEQGDPRARSVLQRIVARDKSPAKREQRVLAHLNKMSI